MLKVGFVGAHGVGKTTLVNTICDRLNAAGCSAASTPEIPRVICEIAQDRGFFRRANNTPLRQAAILLGQAMTELRFSENRHSVLLCDRTVLDHWAYAKFLFGGAFAEARVEDAVAHFVRQHCASYRLILRLPIEFPAEDDGTREEDAGFQVGIDETLVGLLNTWNLPAVTVRGALDERADAALGEIRAALSYRSTTMKNVYISGALKGASDLARVRRLYEGFAEACADAGWRPYLPHEHTDPETAPSVSSRVVVKRDITQLEKADAVVVYLGEPSLGAGAETAIALSTGKRVLAVWEKGASVSRFIEGLVDGHGCARRYAFVNLGDAQEWIRRQLTEIARQRSGTGAASGRGRGTKRFSDGRSR